MYTPVEAISEGDWRDIVEIVSAHRRRVVTPEAFRVELPHEAYPQVEYFLCRRDGKVVGLARVYEEPVGVYVNGLFVNREYRRHGVAREIGVAVLARHGHRRMRLHVDTRLTWLVQAYAGAGFVLQDGIAFPEDPLIKCMIRLGTHAC